MPNVECLRNGKKATMSAATDESGTGQMCTSWDPGMPCGWAVDPVSGQGTGGMGEWTGEDRGGKQEARGM